MACSRRPTPGHYSSRRMKSIEVLEDIKNRLRTLLFSGKDLGIQSIRDDFFFVVSKPKLFEKLVMGQVFSCADYSEFKKLMHLCGYSFISPDGFIRGGGKESTAPEISFEEPDQKDLLGFSRSLRDLLKRYSVLEDVVDDIRSRLDAIDSILERSMDMVRAALDKGACKSEIDFQEIDDLAAVLMEYSSEELAGMPDGALTPEESGIEIPSESASSEEEDRMLQKKKNRKKGVHFF
ncbi:hypothetical protein J0A71_06g13020 [Encephalitozoon cuniculi]|nr:hypothetical protein J0A71_06g13020 [Encephalitozoon cuniculi]